MSPRDFLDLASELSTRNSEAAWRSSASRAYYAVFHAARSFLDDLGFAIRRGDQAHAAVYRRLSNSKITDVESAGSLLMDLRGIRNHADYDWQRSFQSVTGRKSVERAEQLLAILANQRTPQILAALKANIRAYERDVLRDVTWRTT